ncbi:MAG: hypothetical protein INQ03_18375 [Candidatus Heimdallarchaeota archaeon]|nr:hypothetical protein [Candidatus Heimdallarchaeota archaeon]
MSSNFTTQFRDYSNFYQIGFYFEYILGSKHLTWLLLIIHLIISILSLYIYKSQDWIVQWYTIVSISQGVSMYELPLFFYIDGIKYFPSYHFPVFYYVFTGLMMITGMNELVGRITLWIFLVSSVFLLLKLGDKYEYVNLYLSSPVLFAISILGTFDVFALNFVLFGVILFNKNRYFESGIVIGLGVMSKTLPLITLSTLALFLIMNREFKDFAKLSIGSILIMGSIISACYFKFENFEYFIVEAQANRRFENMTLWYYIFPNYNTAHNSLEHNYLIARGQIIVMILFLLIQSPLLRRKRQMIYPVISNLTIIFTIILKFLYLWYFLWIMIPGILMFNIGRKLYAWMMIYFIASLGGALWALSNIRSDPQIAFYSMIVLYLSLILLLIFNNIIIKELREIKT